MEYERLYFLVFLDKPSGYKVVCEPETIHFKKKTSLNTITFYLEDDNHDEVNFNGETLTFAIQIIKFWTFNWAFIKIELIVISLVVDANLVQKT